MHIKFQKLAAILMFAVAILQFIGFLRYLQRLPNDVLGIALYIIVLIALLILSYIFYTKSRK